MSVSLGSGLFSKMASAVLSHLVRPGAGLKGEIYDIRADIVKALKPLAANVVEEWTAPPTGATTSIKTSAVSSTSAQKFVAANFNGALAGGPFSPPRRVTMTTTDHVATYSGVATIKGKDIDGRALSETVAIANNTTATTNNFFASVSEIDIPAQADALGHFAFGVGADIGLAKNAKLRTTAALVLHEIMDGAVIEPPTGTLTGPLVNGPHGGYTPAAAPNGTHNYCIQYEYDAASEVDA